MNTDMQGISITKWSTMRGRLSRVAGTDSDKSARKSLKIAITIFKGTIENGDLVVVTPLKHF